VSLRDAVLQVIALVGGKREPGLALINQRLHSGLLDLALLAPDGSTLTEFSEEDCKRRTIHAPLNPAEGVRVEPYEAGQHFVRRSHLAKLTSPTTPATAADRQLPLPAPEADAAPTPGAEVEPEGSPSATQQTTAPADAQPQPRASRRRRNQGSGPQTLRARVVLKRMYGGAEEYPPRDEVADVDLLDRFAKEYEKVEGKANPPSRLKMPSDEVVLREVGRKD
jgi:hypothetical protein